MRLVVRSGISAALLGSSIVACNALTGVSDLTPCNDCGDGAIAFPEGGGTDGDGAASADARVGPDGATGDGATGDGAVGDGGNKDAGGNADAGLIGCQGAVDCTRVVFVTSMAYTGNLGGIVGADSKCQALADASTNLGIKGRTFEAWVSTAATPVSARLTHGTQPYVLGDATVIATDWVDLTDGILAHPIDLDELGTVHVNAGAWTATASSGAGYAGAGCESFTNGTAGSGFYGNVSAPGGAWSSLSEDPCNKANLLYCFEK